MSEKEYVKKLFSLENEKNKDRKKNDLRILSLVQRTPVGSMIGNQNIWDISQIILILNKEYLQNTNKYYEQALEEIEKLISILKSIYVEEDEKIDVLIDFTFVFYKYLVKDVYKIKVVNSKIIKRMCNLRKIAQKVKEGKFSKQKFKIELDKQIKFIQNSYEMFQKGGADNFYYLILRYDLRI